MTIILIFAAVAVLGFGIMAFVMNAKDKKALQDELKRTQNQKTAAEEVIKNYTEAKKENEELFNEMLSGSNNDAATASLDLLHKLSEKGKDRNKQ